MTTGKNTFHFSITNVLEDVVTLQGDSIDDATKQLVEKLNDKPYDILEVPTGDNAQWYVNLVTELNSEGEQVKNHYELPVEYSDYDYANK